MDRIRIMNVASLSLFLVVSIMVEFDILIPAVDLSVKDLILSAKNPGLIFFFSCITNLGSFYSITAMSIIVVALLAYRRRVKDGLFFSVSMLSTFLIEKLIKVLIHRPRPIDNLIPISGYSFPSGHATMIAIFSILVCYLYRRKIIYIVAIVITLLVGFSRIYLNVHWLSDVLAGYILAFYMFSTFVIIREHLDQSKLFS